MKLSAIRDEVKGIVDDPAFTDKQINQFINAAYFNAVSEAKLPEYKRAGTVTLTRTSNMVCVTDYIEDFREVIQYIFDGSLNVYTSVEEMLKEENVTVLGEVDTELKAVALEGTNLWYYPSLDTQLPMLYLANPEVLEYDSDEVTLFPELIQRKVCVHGACTPCFNVIEDALENPDKLNTNYHKRIYEEGVLKLKEWHGRRRTHKTTSTWSV